MKLFRQILCVVSLGVVVAACATEDPIVPPAALPSQKVEVHIDDGGVAHIYAENDEDLFFAYGYQIASDRMLQLEMFRRFAHGRLSEILGADGPGSAGEDSISDDRFAHIFNWKHWGKLDAQLMKETEPEDYRLSTAWVAGINKRVAEIRSGQVPRPFGFGEDALDFLPESWSDDDPYIVQKMAGFGLDQTIQYEVFVTFTKRLAPKALEAVDLFTPARPTYSIPLSERPMSPQSLMRKSNSQALACAEPPIVPGGVFGSLKRLSHMKPLGSNNWAISGEHTKNGMPFLAGDPHMGYAFSGLTYPIHLNSKNKSGTFDVEGFSFAGAPGIFAGHNRKVAWTPTSSFADVMDMWGVTIKDGKADIGGELIAVSEREEVIHIKGREPETFLVTDVPGYGVVMPSSLVSPLPIAGPGKKVLVGWTGFKARPARYFRALARVQSLEEFEEAVLSMGEMSYNFMAADKTGISYRVGVQVPKRQPLKPGAEPFWIMDAGDPGSLWTGEYLSASQLPHSRGADRGWLATANNDPFGFTDDGRVDNDAFYYGALFPPGWRAMRIESEIERLVKTGSVQLDDMKTLQMDSHSNIADDLLPLLAESYAEIDSNPDLGSFANRPELDYLHTLLTKDWDREMKRDSAGALAFHIFAHYATEGVIEDDLSSILYEVVLSAAPMYMLKIATLALGGRYPAGDGVMQEGKDTILLQALARTAAFLQERFGGVQSDRYRFSDMRVSNMDNAYGRGAPLMDVPTDGGESTVNVAQSKFRKDGKILPKFQSHWGPIERQIFSFDADGTPVTHYNNALGNVADKSSPHFDDAMEDWVNGTYRKMPFRSDEVKKATRQTRTLPAQFGQLER